MTTDRDPAEHSPADRAREVAALLAAALRRLRDRAALGPDSLSQKCSDSQTNELAVSAHKSVTVSGG
jgi:hypothetical protein